MAEMPPLDKIFCAADALRSYPEPVRTEVSDLGAVLVFIDIAKIK